jgi:hypothetical protein
MNRKSQSPFDARVESRYRLGRIVRAAFARGAIAPEDNQVIMGNNGPADISVEDFAVAMVDEAQSAIHRRQRFTIAN